MEINIVYYRRGEPGRDDSLLPVSLLELMCKIFTVNTAYQNQRSKERHPATLNQYDTQLQS